MENLTSHGDHIAIDSNEVLGELGTFLEGVAKSDKLIWTSIQDRSKLWKPRENVARYYQWNSYPTHVAEIEGLLIILFASLDPYLFRREAHARLKDDHALDPFDDQTAVVHRSQISVSQNSSWEFEAIGTVLWTLKAY